jgi:hypothetical protein
MLDTSGDSAFLPSFASFNSRPTARLIRVMEFDVRIRARVRLLLSAVVVFGDGMTGVRPRHIEPDRFIGVRTRRLVFSS